jgi:hypothetical protein
VQSGQPASSPGVDVVVLVDERMNEVIIIVV